MDPLEIQLRRCSRSWTALTGAAGTSALLFVAMASISIVVHPAHQVEERPLTYAFTPPPPPPVETKNRPAVSVSVREAFKFDPTTASPPPEVPLDLLEINLNPAFESGLTIEMDLQRTFAVQKPPSPDQVVVFERNQVDEIPVWLYGSQPRIPSRFDNADWHVNVLYIVNEKGTTEKIFVLDATDPVLIEPVKNAIASWRFRPGRKNGKPVRVWVQQPVQYEHETKSPFTL